MDANTIYYFEPCGKQIKIEADKAYAQIKSAENMLSELRKICKHEKTFDGEHSAGFVVMPVVFCEYCGEIVKFK